MGADTLTLASVSLPCADGLAGVSLFLKQHRALSRYGIGRQVCSRIVPEGLSAAFQTHCSPKTLSGGEDSFSFSPQAKRLL